LHLEEKSGHVPATMQRLYQQPTGESLYAAAMEVGKSG